LEESTAEQIQIVRTLEAKEETRWSIFWTCKLQLEFHFGCHSAAETTTFENVKPCSLKSSVACQQHMKSVMLVAFIGSLNLCAQSRERAKPQESKTMQTARQKAKGFSSARHHAFDGDIGSRRLSHLKMEALAEQAESAPG
jgi:hypothetical protein